MTTNPPAQDQPTFTKHTCCPEGRGPAWGRKTPGCPRCDELLAGAAPRQAPAWVERAQRRQADAEQTEAARRAHFAPNGPHARGDCGPVCTAFDW